MHPNQPKKKIINLITINTNPKTRSTPPDATIQALRWLRPCTHSKAQSWSDPKDFSERKTRERGFSIRSGQEPGSPSILRSLDRPAWGSLIGYGCWMCRSLRFNSDGLAGSGTGTSTSWCCSCMQLKYTHPGKRESDTNYRRVS